MSASSHTATDGSRDDALEGLGYARDERGVVTLTFDAPGRSVNVIDSAFGEAFSAALDRLASENDVRGVILTSGKTTFIAGGDIDTLYAIASPADAYALVEAFKAKLRRLERLGVPVVAALNGSALGGGLEVALACHHRIALDDAKARFGLPEVTLGLLPGGGGVTRLVRLLGLQAAQPFLIEGQRVGVQEALAAGLIDDIAPSPEAMIDKAHAWIEAHPDARAPWDERGFQIPGGDPRHPKIAQMLAVAPALLRQKTWGNYPAPEAILSAAVEGALVDFDTASQVESRYFAQVATSIEAKNMIGAFWYDLNEVNAGGSRPDGPRVPTENVGVLGAGMMGHGIAYVSATAGMEVVLNDAEAELAEAGKARIADLTGERVARGKMTNEQEKALLGRIRPTGKADALDGCDLVIEAVFEDRALKAKVTEEAEAVMDPDGVFASNTSTLPITGLAEASRRPERFIGLHFFSPVHKMKLVEIIVGEQTGEAALRKAFDYVRAIGKTPIVVNDSRGFYTSRVFGTYVNEGLALLGEGQPARTIEVAGRQAGMPVGPLALADEVSLRLMQHIRRQTARDLEAEGRPVSAHPAYAVLDTMLEAGRAGRAHGGGFYAYPEGEDKHLWAGLADRFEPVDARLDQKTLMDRLLYVQALETVRCLDEGVLRSVADANIGSIFGWGFAPFRGGTLQFINAVGLQAFVERSRALADRFGDRFTPPASLVERAATGELYGRPRQETAASS